MGIVVTQRWNGQFMSKRPPWRAGRVYDVTGTTDPDAATAAIADQRGNQWVPGSPLVCQGPEIVGTPGPQHFVVQSVFEAPTGAIENFGTPFPTTVEWQTVEQFEPVDVDLDGRTIMNTAQDAFDPPSRRTVFKRLTVRRREPFYDVGKSEAYENTTNSDAITITFGGQSISVDVEHMRCNSIQPEQPYNGYEPAIIIAYNFDVVLDGSLGDYPFQHRFVNRGRNGWYTFNGNTTRGRFCDTRGEALEAPVLLAQNGTIHAGESNVKCGDGTQSVVAPPNAASDPFYKYKASGANGVGDSIWFKGTALTAFAGLL